MRKLDAQWFGGVFLIGGALAFMGVFAFLAARFNAFLGNYIGEFLGELSLSLFFLLSALAMLDPAARFARWIGYLGIFVAIAGLLGMFRNVTTVVGPVAAANNYLLPLWMIVFGVALIRHPDQAPAEL